jgi:hypothetical protein
MLRVSGPSPVRMREWRWEPLAFPHTGQGLAHWVGAVNRRANAMRYLSAVCFLAM